MTVISPVSTATYAPSYNVNKQSVNRQAMAFGTNPEVISELPQKPEKHPFKAIASF